MLISSSLYFSKVQKFKNSLTLIDVLVKTISIHRYTCTSTSNYYYIYYHNCCKTHTHIQTHRLTSEESKRKNPKPFVVVGFH